MQQTTTPAMIQASDVTHYYGPYPAIQNVNFSVRKGEVLGFLGPNGAGKTTTMRILTGFLPPSRGAVSVDGFDVVEKSLDVRRRVGYLPETVPLYTDMTVTGYLKYMGTLRGMPGARIRPRLAEVIDVCRLGDYRKTQIGKLSKGFRQRVGIAQAIMHRTGSAGAGRTHHRHRPHPGSRNPQPHPGAGPAANRGFKQPHPARSEYDLRAGAHHPRGPHRGRGYAAKPGPGAYKGWSGWRWKWPARRPKCCPRCKTSAASSASPTAASRAVRPTSSRPSRAATLRDDISRTVIGNGWSLRGMQLMGMSLEENFPAPHHPGGLVIMRTVRAVAWKEIQIFFLSPTAYIVGMIFLALAGFFFSRDLGDPFPEATLSPFFQGAVLIFILLAPALTDGA